MDDGVRMTGAEARELADLMGTRFSENLRWRLRDGAIVEPNCFVWRPPRTGRETGLGIERRLYAVDGAPENARRLWTVPVVRDRELAQRTGKESGIAVWWWNGDEDAPVLSPSLSLSYMDQGDHEPRVVSHGYLGAEDGSRPGVWVPCGDVAGEVEVVYTHQERAGGGA